MTPQELGSDLQKRLAVYLSQKGYFVRSMPYKSPFDLMVGNKRVEVKCARINPNGEWMVNIHRHGVLDEKQTDAYVIGLIGMPGRLKKTLYLVMPAPIRKATLQFTIATLLRKHHKYIDNWAILGDPLRLPKESAA